VSLDPAERSGILTHLGFLAANARDLDTDPVMRGSTVLSSVLCTDLQIPANVVVPPLADRTPDQTTRQQYEQLTTLPCAQACHNLLAVGFAFENYDVIGAYRSSEAGKPVDASGNIPLPSGPLVFHDAVELTRLLAARTDVHECMAKQWLRYLLRRREGTGEAASLRAGNQAFAASSHDLRELIVALTKTRAFTHRTASAGEPVP
jgi:hypothetical protein